MKLISLSPCLSLILTPLLVVLPLSAQMPVPPAGSSVDSPSLETLQVHVVESDGPQIPVNSQSGKGFTVEVRDSAGNVVPDAAVALRLPESGATGMFSDGTHAAVSYTDSTGRTRAAAIRWGATPGLIALRITATKGTAHAGLLVEETLTSTSSAIAQPVAAPTPVATSTAAPAPQQPGTLASPSVTPPPAPTQQPAVSVTGGSQQSASHSKAKWIAIVALIAGAGAGAALAMGKGKRSSSTPATPGISIGTPTISVGSGH
ncbi:MAG: hypothetical protein JOZ48_15915 [Acidobacteriaceae bacterium]|nr:hypothetical protein [Acidobacteriaceae bacterium]